MGALHQPPFKVSRWPLKCVAEVVLRSLGSGFQGAASNRPFLLLWAVVVGSGFSRDLRQRQRQPPVRCFISLGSPPDFCRVFRGTKKNERPVGVPAARAWGIGGSQPEAQSS